MKASDIAKLAASIAAGSITYEAARDSLDPEHHSLLDAAIAAGAGAVAGSVAAAALDATGASDLIDDATDFLFGD